MSGHSCISKNNRRRLVVALAFLCCALIAFIAIVQVAHTHANGQWAQSDCALCQAAHVVALPAVLLALAPVGVPVVTRVLLTLPPASPQHLFTYSLFTRPPPVDPAFA